MAQSLTSNQRSTAIVRPKGAGYARFYRTAMLAALLLMPALLLIATFDTSSRLSLVLVGVLCTLAISFPILIARNTLLIEPILPISLSVLLGCGARSFYLAFSDNGRVSDLMLGQSYAEIASNGIWILLGLFCFSVGYALTSARLPLERISIVFDRLPSRGDRKNLALWFAVAGTLVALAIFFTTYDIGFSLDTLSAKRATTLATEDGEEVYTSLGYVRLLNELGASALIFYVASKLQAASKITSWSILVATLLFVLAAAMPFLSSSRSNVAILLVSLIAIAYIYNKLKGRWVFIGIMATILIVVGMANLRYISNNVQYSESDTIIDTIIGTGHFVDIGRTSAIISKVPEQRDYLYGSSYAALLTAPIPKSMWPDKPNPSLGPWVRSELFGLTTRNTGWPPNLIGEAYLNFGLAGILIACTLVGALIKAIYNSFAPLLGKNIVATTLYVAGFWSLSFRLIQANLAQGLMQAALDMLPMLVLALLATFRHRENNEKSVRL